MTVLISKIILLIFGSTGLTPSRILGLAGIGIGFAALLAASGCIFFTRMQLNGLREQNAALRENADLLGRERDNALAALDFCRREAGLGAEIILQNQRDKDFLQKSYDEMRTRAMSGSSRGAKPLFPAASIKPSTKEPYDDQAFKEWCAQPVPAFAGSLLFKPPVSGTLSGHSSSIPSGRNHPAAP